jgi:outer membrane protein OmpA-like peptidoglycan-associated protein
MAWFSLIAALTALFQFTTIQVNLVTITEGSNLDIPLVPARGEVEAQRRNGLTRLEVRINGVEALALFGPALSSWVVWAVSPEGDFLNLGELVVDGRNAELDTQTSLQRFGLIITAEPYHSVDAPSDSVAMSSGTPRESRVETTLVDVGFHDYSAIDLPPQGNIGPRVIQARMAFRIAESEGAAGLADPEFRQARVAYDSMEELLRRGMDRIVLETYINDAIRLSSRAIRVARQQRVQNALADAERRAGNLVEERDRLEAEIVRLDRRIADTSTELDRMRGDLQDARNINRQLELEGEESDRELRAAESRIGDLEDWWTPMVDALIAAGARQTPRGVQITLPAARFEDGEAEFEDGTREALSRLVGILAYADMPEIRIEGHVRDSGPASRSLTLSEERAFLVRDYLVDSGIWEEQILAEGFGTSRPIPGVEEPSDPIHERVEIMIIEP